MDRYNIFIDESCHLEHDRNNVMAIGYVKVNINDTELAKNNIKRIKAKYGIFHEIKWNTISNTKKDLYKDLIDYFFESPLKFRCLLVKYKDRLDNNAYNAGSHDNFYYKMAFYLLSNEWLNPNVNEYRVFLDIKDTRGKEKLDTITDVFNNKFKGNSPFVGFQHIRSHENIFIQLSDILIGAITFKARKLDLQPDANITKKYIVNYLEEKSGYLIDEGTEPWEEKFNIFDHQPRKK